MLLHHYNAKSEKKRDFQKQKGSGVTRAIFVDGDPDTVTGVTFSITWR